MQEDNKPLIFKPCNPYSTVFIVTYQSYIYPYNADEEVKRLINNNFEVSGVFSTRYDAESFIQERILTEANDLYGEDDDIKKEFIKKEEYHYSIWEKQINKYKLVNQNKINK